MGLLCHGSFFFQTCFSISHNSDEYMKIDRKKLSTGQGLIIFFFFAVAVFPYSHLSFQNRMFSLSDAFLYCRLLCFICLMLSSSSNSSDFYVRCSLHFRIPCHLCPRLQTCDFFRLVLPSILDQCDLIVRCCSGRRMRYFLVKVIASHFS